jgi:Arc/MetJ-type ribon-helix-helix transcriptional regulator
MRIELSRTGVSGMASGIVRTTLTLPVELVEAADQAVRAGRARSRSELVAAALRRELADQERAAIDAGFAGMADDQEYQAEAETLSAEFAVSDWEALRLGEGQRRL